MIERAGRILIAQRGPGSHLALLWEFPGGKREPGETWEACLARELAEELGVEAEVGAWLDGVTHEYGDRVIRLRFYRCRLVRGEPAAVTCHAVRWVRPGNLARYAFPEADAGLVSWLASNALRRRDADRRAIVRVAFRAGGVNDRADDAGAGAPSIAALEAVAEMPYGSSLEAAAERCRAGVIFGCRTGDCGACAVRVVSGAACLSAPTPAEIAWAAGGSALGDAGPGAVTSHEAVGGRRPAAWRPRARLACQACALGDVVLERAPDSRAADWL